MTVVKCQVLHRIPQTALCPYVSYADDTYGDKNRLFHIFTGPITTSIHLIYISNR